VGSHVRGVEAVAAGERDGVGEDGAGDGVARAETCAVDDGLGVLALKSN
jgi:hypothetical protein